MGEVIMKANGNRKTQSQLPDQSGDSGRLCSEEKHDALDHLLQRNAKAHPVTPSDWFAARTAAMSVQTPQKHPLAWLGWNQLFSRFSRRSRWLLPIPVAGFAALAFLLIQHETLQPHQGSLTTAVPVSTEAEFEQHIELIASTDDYTQ